MSVHSNSWACLIPTHTGVEWVDDFAYCLHCGLTSDLTNAFAHQVRVRQREIDAQAVRRLADQLTPQLRGDDVTPEERSEALIEAIQAGDQDALVDSWLAEKDAEIERLSTSDWNGWADAINRARADERRRTAEKIAQAVAALDPQQHKSGRFADDFAAHWCGGYDTAATDVARICDEVGGSDEDL